MYRLPGALLMRLETEFDVISLSRRQYWIGIGG